MANNKGQMRVASLTGLEVRECYRRYAYAGKVPTGRTLDELEAADFYLDQRIARGRVDETDHKEQA